MQRLPGRHDLLDTGDPLGRRVGGKGVKRGERESDYIIRKLYAFSPRLTAEVMAFREA